MTLIQRFLNKAFPLMALFGLILAGWGLIVAPEELHQDKRTLLSQSSAPD